MNDIFADREFGEISRRAISEMVAYLLGRGVEFAVLVESAHADFEPALPDEIYASFDERVLFVLSGYTLQSACLDGDRLSFEAGFGAENFGSVVTVPVGAIRQIYSEGIPVAINSAKMPASSAADGDSSMEALLSNPENMRLFKKKRNR